MQHHHYFFEFAGMPQAGKTEIVDIVAHYLRRKGYTVEVYNGGSEYSPLHDAPIADLNLSLACQVVNWVLNKDTCDNAEHKIYLLDRGLIDRNIFTDALLWSRRIDETQAKAISAILTQPRLLKCLDGVYLFVTSPEIALEREQKDKLIESLGQVMEPNFLSTLRLATENGHIKAKSYLRNIHLIDTERYNTRVRDTASLVVGDILHVIKEEKKVGVNTDMLKNESTCTHFNKSRI